MNQLKVFLIQFVALWCICGLAKGESEQQICVPLGSVPYEPSPPVDCSTNGYYIDYRDRSKFFECSGGTRYNFECQTGLYFDVESKRCEWPRNLKCNPMEKPCPNGSVVVIPSQPNNCSKSDRNYYNNLSNPKYFHQCWDGQRFDFKCQPGLYFDRANERCEWATNMRCYDYVRVSN